MSVRAIPCGDVVEGPTQRTSKRGRATGDVWCEPLEGRLLLVYIEWDNRGNEGFDAASAPGVRRPLLVDIAIADWSYAIQNFNYTTRARQQIHASRHREQHRRPFGLTGT